MPQIHAALLTKEDINDQCPKGPARKQAFHREGKKFLAAVATELGLQKGDYDLRSNVAGPAVSGEVTLHADSFYLQLCPAIFGRGITVLHRSCKHRKDYSGGTNYFVDVSALQEARRYKNFLDMCRKWMAEGQERTDTRIAA